MKYISGQDYLQEEIVEEKKQELLDDNETEVVVPCYYVGIIDDVEYAVVADKHHTMAAGRELGLYIVFDVVDHPEGLKGEDLLSDMVDGNGFHDAETGEYI